MQFSVTEQRTRSPDDRFLCERKKQIRWIAAKRFSVKPRRGDTDPRERNAVDDQLAVKDQRIESVVFLPDAVTDHHGRRGSSDVVGGSENPAGRRRHSESGEVVA